MTRGSITIKYHHCSIYTRMPDARASVDPLKMEWYYLFAFIGLLLAVLHYYSTCTFQYWKDRSIPCVEGAIPGLGNISPMLFMKQNFSQMYEDFYNKMTGYSMAGFYNLREPSLIVRDPELVKTVLQNDFHSFGDNQFQLDEKLDPLITASPFFLNGERWKAARTTMSAAFTSGKLKYMYVSIEHVCAQLTKYLNEKLERNNGVAELELKELFTRYSAEVVAAVAFGVEGDSFNSDKTGPFLESGKVLFEPSMLKGLKQMLVLFVPFISKVVKMRIVPPHIDRFFRKLVTDALRIREEQGLERNDFLQLMISLRKASSVRKIEGMLFDDASITAHATSFFIDGYETTSITISFIGYHLAAHPDVQQRLRQEVKSIVSKHGSLTYDAFQEMTYMDQVVNESARLYPAFATLVKLCTKETVLEGSDGLTLHIKPGTLVVVPIQGLHKDPKYWPNPEKFDPERFNADVKQDRHKFVYLPFGAGPRACVGMRLALLQAKASIATLVLNYSLELSPKTKLPLQMDPNYFLASAIGGLWVLIKPL